LPHDHDHSHGGHHQGGHRQGHSHGGGGHRHGGGHSHAHQCGGLDHHSGDYTPEQRADLDLVLAFNRRMSEAINAGLDVQQTEEFLDPDPLRYMWVDEGQGQIRTVIGAAHQILDSAPELAGHQRRGVAVVPGSRFAARPSTAVGPDGARLTTWIEWREDQGDLLQARYEPVGHAPSVAPSVAPAVVSGEVADVFRPTALISATGVPWVFFGRSDAGAVAVWATAFDPVSGWSAPAVVSTSEHPSFNQEVAAHPDGRLELCWQGRDEGRFAIFARTHADGAWGPTRLVSADVQGNVWDPAVAVYADGRVAYAWSEYAEGAYRLVVRQHGADGQLGEPQVLTSGRDYALHASLAVTADQQLWCAFDLITVTGHGGSGPTRLRPSAEVGADPGVVEGMRAGGASVPPELLPDVTASVRVVAVTSGGVQQPPGELAPRLDVVPSGLPKLVATADGGLAVAYRVHRKLPLMTYYWEVATQVLGPQGWLPPTTFSGTDGTLEEPAVAATATGVVVAAQTDARLQVALDWTEGFGGRECPYLMEHQGSIIWHGVHGVGTVVTAEVGSAGPVPVLDPVDDAPLHSDLRHEARRWYASAERERYVARLPGRGSETGLLLPEPVEGPGLPLPEPVEGPSTGSGRGVSTGSGGGPSTGSGRGLSTGSGGGPSTGSGGGPSTGSGSGAREYTLYWGDLHRHSLVSRCTAGDEPSLEDFYRYAWDVCEYDFWAVTDHSENSSAYQWWSIQKIADLFRIDGRFVPLYGFEWTSADSGHQNVIYGDVERGAPIFSAFAEGSTDPAGLWAGLEQHPEFPAITIPHHPGSAMVHNDWDYHSPQHSRLVEIFQACRGNYEALGAFRQYSDATMTGTFVLDGLLRGHRFGLIASSDHGHGASYVGAYATGLDRASVFDALHSRRTFAATTRDVVLDVSLTVGGQDPAFMGEEVDGDGPRTLRVRAEGYTEVARVEVVRLGEVVHVTAPHVERPHGWLVVPLRLEWGESDLTTAWDGRAEVLGGEVVQSPFWSPAVTAVSTTAVSWADTTSSFGELYGAQRGDVEFTVVGPPDAKLSIRLEGRAADLRLGDLVAQPVHVLPGPRGVFRVQPGVGALTGLGSRSVEVEYTDTFTGPAFYYVRSYLVDGEMAWSSPIWVTPTGGPPDGS